MFFSLIDICIGILKILIYKLIHWSRIYFKSIPKANISANFHINKKAKIELGKKNRIRNNVAFYCLDKGKIKIGNNVFFNDNCMISCRDEIKIGNNCFFGNCVSIYDNDHDYKNDLNKYKTSKVIIGEGTWVGCNVTILRGCNIGKNCVIAAGTIVNCDIHDNSIVYNEKNTIVKHIERKNK